MSFFIDIAMAWLYLRFVTAHYVVFAVTHGWQVGLVVAQETLLMVLFLARKRTQAVSRRPQDWIVAGMGTFGPLMLRPTGTSVIGTALQIAGLAGSILSLLSLRRSFGIVAALRETVTSGMYNLVRHPQYAAHHVLLVGYLVASPTAYNAAVVLGTLSALWLRLLAEELLLLDVSPEYRAYVQRVRWRVIPGVL